MAKQKVETVFSLSAHLAHFRTLPVNTLTAQTLKSMEDRLEALRTSSFTALRDQQAFAAGYDTGSGWWEACQLMYPLFSVTDAADPAENGLFFRSEAADWENPEEHVYGPFPSDFERLTKILQLIKYKENDRKYGIGSVDKDFARVQERFAA
jgi:hypothetical protein